MAEPRPYTRSQFWRSRSGITLFVLGGVAAFYLLEEHRAHLLGILPYLIFLACPLMHHFMHHGHHDHGKPSSDHSAEEHRHDRS